MKIEITDTGVMINGTQRDVVLMITTLMAALQAKNVFSNLEGLTFKDIINQTIDDADSFNNYEKNNPNN